MHLNQITVAQQESTNRAADRSCECHKPGNIALGSHSYLRIGEENPRECSTGFFISVGRLLPDHVRKASGSSLHLEKRSEDGHPPVYSTGGSFFIQGPDADVNSLIKLWFIHHCLKKKTAQGSILEISDLEVVKWENRDFSRKDDDLEQDAMEARLVDASLVVLRLGSLVVKSPRNPAWIEQMIKLRGSKPIWVIDSEDVPFNKNSPCYSAGMATLLSRMGLVKFSNFKVTERVISREPAVSVVSSVSSFRVDWQVAKFPGSCTKCSSRMEVGDLMTFDPIQPGLKKRICKKNCEKVVGS